MTTEVLTDPTTESVVHIRQALERVLNPEERRLFWKTHRLRVESAPLHYLTQEAQESVEKIFGAEPGTMTSRVCLSFSNKVLGEQAFLNPNRANRPLESSGPQIDIETLKNNNPITKCSFCDWKNKTPQDKFGPIVYKKCRTVANAGAYVACNSLVISDTHHLSDMDSQTFADMVQTGIFWREALYNYTVADQASEEPEYAYYDSDQELNEEGFSTLPDPAVGHMVIGFNGKERGGSSIYHPHLQLVATREAVDKVAEIRERIAGYCVLNNGSCYFDDLATCLRPLGLVHDFGQTRFIMDLVPIKEKGVLVCDMSGSSTPTEEFSRGVFAVTQWYTKKLKSQGFDVVMFMAPHGVDINVPGPYYGFHPFARLVDRGMGPVSDIAFMEAFVSPVIGSNASRASRSLGEHLEEALAV